MGVYEWIKKQGGVVDGRVRVRHYTRRGEKRLHLQLEGTVYNRDYGASIDADVRDRNIEDVGEVIDNYKTLWSLAGTDRRYAPVRVYVDNDKLKMKIDDKEFVLNNVEEIPEDFYEDNYNAYV